MILLRARSFISLFILLTAVPVLTRIVMAEGSKIQVEQAEGAVAGEDAEDVQAPSVDVQTLVTEAMDRIRRSIEARSKEYDILDRFDSAAVRVNSHGFNEIAYVRPLGQRSLFELLVHVVPLKVYDLLEKRPGHAEASFPLLGVRVLWALRGGMYVKTLDMDKIMRKGLSGLFETQQKMLPLSLSVESEQETYRIGQIVEFDLVLKNLSENSLKVKELDEGAVACSFNKEKWGQGFRSDEPKVILRPGGILRKRLKLLGIKRPGDLDVRCTYGLGFAGVLPAVEKTFRIRG